MTDLCGYVLQAANRLNLLEQTLSFRIQNSVLEIFLIIYKYFKKNSFIDIVDELNIHRKTIGTYTSRIRESIMDEVEGNNERLGGYDENGEPKIVEIDESLFFKSK